jgi:capsular polysaccharide biosynthesis protein
VRAPGAAIARLVRWLRFAGMFRTFHRQQTMTLASATFDELCARASASAVTSADGLLAGWFRKSRCWTLCVGEPAVTHTGIVAMDGAKPPSFPNALPSERWLRQAYLRTRRGIVFPKVGIIMCEPGFVHRINLPNWTADHRLLPGFANFADGAIVARTAALRPDRRIRRTVLVLCHAYHRNYGHWLLDILPCLRPWISLLRQHRLAVLLPPVQGQWQRRTLDLLGVPASAVIEASEPSVLCDDMIIPGLTMPDWTDLSRFQGDWIPQPGAPVIETITALKRGLLANTEIKSAERIYVSRRRLVSFREMSNEEEIEAALAPLGFAIIYPQDLTFDQQVAIFSRARVVVGQHGAGLTNAAFASPGCLVIDVFPGHWSTRWMLRLTQLFGHHYLPVTYANDPALSQPILLGNTVIGQSQVYRVPPEEFSALVTRAITSWTAERARMPGDTISAAR